MLEEQCCRKGYNQSSYLPVEFTESGHVSISLNPNNIPDWKWSYNGFCYDYVSILLHYQLLYYYY